MQLKFFFSLLWHPKFRDPFQKNNFVIFLFQTMETERKLESQVPSSEAVPPVYSTQAVTQPVERTRNKAVPRPKACNHPVTGCRRLTSENRLTPFCRTRHGKQLQPFGPSNGLFFKKLGLTFMIHRYCCDSAQRIPHTHDIVVTHNHDFLDGWYLQNVTDSKTNSVRDLIQELKKRFDFYLFFLCF